MVNMIKLNKNIWLIWRKISTWYQDDG
jgi:hypothetical protein